MKTLRNKTFYTIFTIISLFGICFIILFNTQVYKREYSDILNSITRMRTFISSDKDKILREPNNHDNELRNRMIMDYEVFTFVLDSDKNIIEIISHSDSNINKDILEKAEEILNNEFENKIKIGNLYVSNYAYNLSNQQFLTIVNITNSRTRLLIGLITSLILFCLGEIIVYIISKKITDWITTPVEQSFNNQKEFVANASHELKTPLAVMIASIDCLEPNKKNTKWINNLKSESERMNNLITRLLDLSKSENYIFKEDFSLNDISKIIEKRSLTFESLAFEKNIKVETNIQKNIEFECNKESIDELISILIDNAISHSIKNSKIIINLSKSKSEIKLEIINQGEAIPAEECEKIFERFYRNDKSHNRKSNRYGLGLATAKNIVVAHNGTITANSKDGYTTFKVNFKIK